jgi:hypothetical protein
MSLPGLRDAADKHEDHRGAGWNQDQPRVNGSIAKLENW